jgi:tetratricopeptide (TPR) repeat protein
MVITMMGQNDGLSYLPNKDMRTSRITLFLRFFKTHKLAKLLWLHMVAKAKEIGIYNPKDDKFTKSYSRIYIKDSSIRLDPVKAEDPLKENIELNLNNSNAYMELGQFYNTQGKFKEAEEALKKAIELNPSSDSVYSSLGHLYNFHGKFKEAEQAFRKALELDSNNGSTYVGLGDCYIKQERIKEAEEAFKKAITLEPFNTDAYFKLGSMYLEQGKYILAEEAFKKAIEADPAREKAYGGLITLYRETDKGSISKYYIEVLNNLRLKYYSPFVRSNYHKLKEILDKRGIKLVCAQYPMRNIEPLKMMFEPQEQEQIIFVDNEKIFEDALKKSSYKEYFIDLFAGDFGHCTGKGHKLIAENIANVILKEVFHR